MKTITSLAQTEKLMAEMTDQLVEDKLSWETCKQAARKGLLLVQNSLASEPGNEDRELEELAEKFAGILQFRPESQDEEITEQERMQYKRYHMILALDTMKKLVFYLKENQQRKK